MWIPPEEADPILLHAPTRKGIGVFGAVRCRDGRLITHMEKNFDAMTFFSFLQKLLRHHQHGRKMVVILDNARWHHARLLRPWLHAHRDMLQLIFLPPYSPEMNHAERVWKLTRTLCTHNRYFAELEELIEAVSNQFDEWYEPNDTLRRLCAII